MNSTEPLTQEDLDITDQAVDHDDILLRQNSQLKRSPSLQGENNYRHEVLIHAEGRQHTQIIGQVIEASEVEGKQCPDNTETSTSRKSSLTITGMNPNTESSVMTTNHDSDFINISQVLDSNDVDYKSISTGESSEKGSTHSQFFTNYAPALSNTHKPGVTLHSLLQFPSILQCKLLRKRQRTLAILIKDKLSLLI